MGLRDDLGLTLDGLIASRVFFDTLSTQVDLALNSPHSGLTPGQRLWLKGGSKIVDSASSVFGLSLAVAKAAAGPPEKFASNLAKEITVFAAGEGVDKLVGMVPAAKGYKILADASAPFLGFVASMVVDKAWNNDPEVAVEHKITVQDDYLMYSMVDTGNNREMISWVDANGDVVKKSISDHDTGMLYTIDAENGELVFANADAQITKLSFDELFEESQPYQDFMAGLNDLNVKQGEIETGTGILNFVIPAVGDVLAVAANSVIYTAANIDYLKIGNFTITAAMTAGSAANSSAKFIIQRVGDAVDAIDKIIQLSDADFQEKIIIKYNEDEPSEIIVINKNTGEILEEATYADVGALSETAQSLVARLETELASYQTELSLAIEAAIEENPNLLDSITDPELRAKVTEIIASSEGLEAESGQVYTPDDATTITTDDPDLTFQGKGLTNVIGLPDKSAAELLNLVQNSPDSNGDQRIEANWDLFEKIQNEGTVMPDGTIRYVDGNGDIYEIKSHTDTLINTEIREILVTNSVAANQKVSSMSVTTGDVKYQVVEVINSKHITNEDGVIEERGQGTVRISVIDEATGQAAQGETVELIYPKTFLLQQAGGFVGAKLGVMVSNGSFFQDAFYVSALKTVGQHTGTFLDLVGAGTTTADAVVGATKGADTVQLETLPELFEGFLVNFVGQVGSLVGGEIAEEVTDMIGLDGFAGGVVNVGVNTVTTKVTMETLDVILHNVNPTLFKDFGNGTFELTGDGGLSVGSVVNAIAGYIGSTLGNELIAAETKEAAILGGLGSALGTAVGAASAAATTATVTAANGITLASTAFAKVLQGFGAAAGPIGVVIGAFVGQVLGNFLGNVIGDKEKPSTWAKIEFDETDEIYELGDNWAVDGASAQVSADMAQQVIEGVQSILDATMGRLRTGGVAPELKIGMFKQSFVVDYNGDLKVVDNAADAIKFAAFKLMKDFDLVGGHTVVMRAWHNSDATNFEEFQTDILVAEAFIKYLMDPASVLAIMMGDPLSDEAQMWSTVLARATALKLYEVSENDYDGGWSEVLLAQGVDPESIPTVTEDNIVTVEDPGTGLITTIQHIFAPGYEIIRIDDGTDADDIIQIIVDGSAITYTDAGAGDDVVIGSPEIDIIYGNDGDDTIEGREGNDWLHGGAGNDTINGNGGQDSVIGARGDDWLYGDEDADNLYGGDDDDVIQGLAGDDLIDGGAGDDRLYGNEGVDLIYGGDGDDVIHLWGGDTAHGGAGDDTFYLGAEGSDVVVIGRDQGHDVVIGNKYAENIIRFDYSIGTDELWFRKSGDDLEILVLGEKQSVTVKDYYLLGGDAGKPEIRFEAFNGDIRLLNPNITLAAGGPVGNPLSAGVHILRPIDLYSEQPTGDYNEMTDEAIRGQGTVGEAAHQVWAWEVINGHTTGHDGTYYNVVTWSGGGKRINEVVNGYVTSTVGNKPHFAGATGNDTIKAPDNPYISNDHYLYGDSGNDKLYGYSGDDTLVGGLGNDTLYGQDDNDHLYGGHGDDTLSAGDGHDFVYGGHGNDLAYGGTGNDYMEGGDGNDDLRGNGGNDTLSGGDGDDTLNGANNHDTIFGDAGNDLIYGGSGNDTLSGGEGDDTLYGHGGDDVLSGGAGDDILSGSTGDDVLSGGDGDDRLDGYTGNAILTGGAGADTFVIGAAYDASISNTDIKDFNVQEGDKIDLQPTLTYAGYLNHDIQDYVQVVENNGVHELQIDKDGLSNGVSFIVFATLRGLNGSFGVQTLLDDGHLIAETPVQAQDDFVYTDIDTAISGNVFVDNGYGADTDDHSFMALAQNITTSNGQFTLNEQGDFSFTPNTGFSGAETITYVTKDAYGARSEAVITVKVAAVIVGIDDVYVETINGTANDDVITGGGGNDHMYGLAGNDVLVGETGSENHYYGGAGNDTFVGNGTTDVLRYSGEAAAVSVNLSTGIATDGSGDQDAIININNVRGSSHNDTFAGNDVEHQIEAGAGDDIITAGSGIATMKGESGADTYVFTAESLTEGNIHQIDGFDVTQGDKIDLSAVINLNTADISQQVQDYVRITDLGSGSWSLEIDANGAADEFVTVANIQNINLNGLNMAALLSAGNIIAPVPNALPVAQDDLYFSQEDEAVSGNLLDDTGNGVDVEPDGDTLIFIAGTFETQEGGQITIQENGDFDYQPKSNFNGTDQYTYQVMDADGGTSQAVVTWQVTAVDDTPIAVNDEHLLREGDSLDINVLDNDQETDGDSLTVTITTQVQNGTVAINTDNTITYTPNAGFTGVENFSYQIDDGQGNTDIADIVIRVVDNTAPIGQDDYMIGQFGDVIMGNLFVDNGYGEDIDIENNPFTAIPETVTTVYGQVTISANGDFSYQSTSGSENVAVTDSFTYQIQDDRGVTSTATAFVNLAMRSDITILNDENDVVDGSDINEAIYGGKGNDIINGLAGSDIISGGAGNDLLDGGAGNDHLDMSAARNAVHVDLRREEASGNGIDRIYNFEHVIGSNHDDVINGNIWDNALYGSGGNDVLFGAQGNDTLNGGSGNDELIGGSGVDTLLGGDGDDILRGGTYADIINGGAGSDTIDYSDHAAAVVVNFTTKYGGFGSYMDSFSNIENVTGSNHADFFLGDSNDNIFTGGLGLDQIWGYGGADTFVITETDTYDVIQDFNVSQGDTLDLRDVIGFDAMSTHDISDLSDFLQVTYDGVSIIVKVDADGTENGQSWTQVAFLSYAYSGLTDIVQYGQSGVLNVGGFNAAPVAQNDSFIGVEDNQITGNLLSDNGSGVDTDPDGDILSTIAETVTSAQGGLVKIYEDGDFNYTPAAHHHGADSFTYQLQDEHGKVTSGTVNISLSAVDDAPDAQDDEGILVINQGPIILDVLTNDIEHDNDTISITLITTNPINGTATINLDGTVTYTANTDYTGADSFTYQVEDGNGGTDTAIMTLNVVNSSDPIANDDLFIGVRDQQLTGNVFADNGYGADTDADGNILTLTAGTFATENGSITLQTNGDFTYTPGATVSNGVSFWGDDHFNYTVHDGNGGTDTAEMKLIIGVTDVMTMGTSGNDLLGTAQREDIYGLGGDDTLNGGDGNDYISGGAGDDTIDGGVGSDTYNAVLATNGVHVNMTNGTATGMGTDTLISIENVIGSRYDDTIIGTTGNDTLNGGSGNDELIGGSGVDTLLGGDGDDILRGGTYADIINGGAGSDTIDYSDHAAAVVVNFTTKYGGFGSYMDSFSNIENVTGSNHADFFLGDSNDNIFTGGLGLDQIWGYGGADTFVFTETDAIDVIKDYTIAENDALDVSDLLSNYDPVTDALADFVEITNSGSSSILKIDLDGAGTTYSMTQIATLEGITGLTDEDTLVTNGQLIVA